MCGVRLFAAITATLLLASCAGDVPPPAATGGEPPAPRASVPGQVRLAGSGAATPLVREALSLLRPRTPGTTWLLEDSVGSAGGVVAGAVGPGRFTARRFSVLSAFITARA